MNGSDAKSVHLMIVKAFITFIRTHLLKWKYISHMNIINIKIYEAK